MWRGLNVQSGHCKFWRLGRILMRLCSIHSYGMATSLKGSQDSLAEDGVDKAAYAGQPVDKAKDGILAHNRS